MADKRPWHPAAMAAIIQNKPCENAVNISGIAMKIQHPQLMFSTWLQLASFQAVKFGQLYVKQKLSYNFRYELYFNESFDDGVNGDFELYPDDRDRVLRYDTDEEVTSELVRNFRIPVWIDIGVFKYSKKFTLLSLLCAGRYTDNVEQLYYHYRGTGCFAVKGPKLPIGYKEGRKFRIEKV